MNYYSSGYRERILSDAKRSSNDARDLMEGFSGSTEETVLFYKLLMVNAKSEHVLNEHVRARYMLLKSCLDSGQ